MAFVQNVPLFSIILTLFGGVLCMVLKPKAARNWILFLFTAIFAASSLLLMYVNKAGGFYVYKMGHFPAPWGNELRIGPLEASMAVAFSGIMILSLMGGLRHIFEDVEQEKINLYFLMCSLLLSSMLVLIYTNDLFTGYVFVEINTVAACALVMLRKSKATLVATVRYLVLSLLGSGMFMMGIIILYAITGHLLMVNIHHSIEMLIQAGKYMLPLEVVIALFCTGMAAKSALFPFHTWLPDAHGSSTGASSAILSGLVLKGYIILLIKIIYRVTGFDFFRFSKASNILFVFGCGGMLFGSFLAILEKDLKRMIAYSSVAQIGYIYMGIGLGSTPGMVAAVFQIVAHAVTKPMLFGCISAFMDVSSGKKGYEDLRGAGRRNGLAGIAFAVGALSMVGIPSLAGFVTKFYLASAGIASGSKMLPAIIVLAISTLLNAIYYIPAVMVLFSGNDRFVLIPDRTNTGFIISTVIFVLLNFVLGCSAVPVIRIITSGLGLFG